MRTSWDATGAGAVGPSQGSFTLEAAVGGHALVRHSVNAYARGRHEDLLVIYVERGAMRALFVDAEGHAIHYTVTADGPAAALLSDEVAGAPRFRRRYDLAPSGELAIDFALQPPAGSELKSYVHRTCAQEVSQNGSRSRARK